MLQQRWRKAFSVSTIAAAVLALSGCAGLVKPDSLKVPNPMTCIDIPAGTEAHEARGLFKIHWTTRLQGGPYIAEREDEQGTFYRAPGGGITVSQDGNEGKPAGMFTHMNYDGGIWIPHDPATPPHLYYYFSIESAPVVPVPEGANCSNATLAGGPNAQGVSAGALAASGAVSGAAGAMIGRSINHNSSMSYGQAAGAGAVGGAIGGLIIAGMINKDIGKIMHQPVSTDPTFVAALQEAAKHTVPYTPAPDQTADIQ